MASHLSPAVLTAVLIAGYLLGSIPFGVIATRLAGVGDVRRIGSRNIGATNVLRTGRRDLALATLVGDAGKGSVAVLLAWRVWGHEAAALAGLAAFLGHLFPVWLRFRGGKGVATFFGILLAAAWPVGLLAGATWIAVFVLSRISSVSALAATALAIAYALVLHEPGAIVALTAVLAMLVYVRHNQNIARLLKGQEPRSGSKPSPAAS